MDKKPPPPEDEPLDQAAMADEMARLHKAAWGRKLEQSMTSKETPKQPMSLLEAAALDLNSQLRAFGHTVTVTAESDGPDYQVLFPPNQGSAKKASASPASTSSPDPKTVK